MDLAKVKVCNLTDIHENRILKIRYQERDIILAMDKGQIAALDALCTHTGEDLSLGYLEPLNGKTAIVCPRHRAKFDLHTGEVLRPPAQGTKISNLGKYEVEVAGNSVYVNI